MLDRVSPRTTTCRRLEDASAFAGGAGRACGWADSGAAVVLDPETGAVLAMASVPTYDPSWWVGGISFQHYQLLTSQADHDPLLNRAIQGSWAPGSTFKLATATAALNDGLLNKIGTYINDPGYYQIPPPCSGECTYYDNTNNGVHEAGQGILDIASALTVSDDVFFYTLGADYWFDSATYGQTPIQDVAEKYGFGQVTGVDVSDEPVLGVVGQRDGLVLGGERDPEVGDLEQRRSLGGHASSRIRGSRNA